jgi:coenzyme F420-reducing hydrogenase alpha subunit
MTIIRESTKEELRDFQPILNRAGKPITSDDKIIKKINFEEQEAVKKGLPFARQAATDDFSENLESQKRKLKKLYGYIKIDELKMPEIDWSKYSDLKNFEVIEKGERYDEHLSKRYMVDVFIKMTKYKYKGYGNTYTIMESPFLAVQRAKGIKDKEVKE